MSVGLDSIPCEIEGYVVIWAAFLGTPEFKDDVAAPGRRSGGFELMREPERAILLVDIPADAIGLNVNADMRGSRPLGRGVRVPPPTEIIHTGCGINTAEGISLRKDFIENCLIETAHRWGPCFVQDNLSLRRRPSISLRSTFRQKR